jgi:hypothetical protein
MLSFRCALDFGNLVDVPKHRRGGRSSGTQQQMDPSADDAGRSEDLKI